MNSINFLLNKGPVHDKPSIRPWSTLPILCVVFGLLSVIALVFIVRRFVKNKKVLNLIIFGYGLLFLGLEIYHQINRYLFLKFYDFSSFPFQFCSIPIYVCLILPFIRNEKVRDSFFYYLGIYCFVGGLFPLFLGQPSLCRWTDPLDVFRSFLWHILILQVSVIAFAHKPIALDLKTSYKPLLGAIGIFISCTIIAQICNVTLHYAGGINFPVTGKEPFKTPMSVSLNDPDAAGCFYISPYIQPTMIVYDMIWKKLGWALIWIIYVASFSLLAVIIYFIHYGIHFAWRVVTKKQKTVNQPA